MGFRGEAETQKLDCFEASATAVQAIGRGA
jgi:hypothetical protein